MLVKGRIKPPVPLGIRPPVPLGDTRDEREEENIRNRSAEELGSENQTRKRKKPLNG